MSEENYIKQISYNIDGVIFYMRLSPGGSYLQGLEDKKIINVGKFYIAETAVTYELWYKVRIWAEKNGYIFANLGVEGNDEKDEAEEIDGIVLEGAKPTEKKRHPVTRVNWRDSMVWCNALTEYYNSLHSNNLEVVYTYKGKIVRDATDENGEACDNVKQNEANGFRLANKEEWEMAAKYIGPRKPSYKAIYRNGIYWTLGKSASGATDTYKNKEASEEVAWYDYNTTSAQEVGLKRPNALGLYDMSGNVWEWTFFKRKIFRGVCGGSWDMFDYFIQVGNYSSFEPTDIYGNPGFRIVRSP